MQPNDKTNSIDWYDKTVIAIKTTKRKSHDLDRQPKIKLNQYNREKILIVTTNRKSP